MFCGPCCGFLYYLWRLAKTNTQELGPFPFQHTKGSDSQTAYIY